MTPRLTALLGLLLAGCASTLHAPRTQPEATASRRTWPAPATKHLLILSPSLLAELTGGATFDGAPPPAADLDGLLSARPGDLALATAAVERAAFDAGWTPISRPGVARLATGHQAAMALRELSARGNATLDEAAVILARGAEAELTLLVRSWTLGWRPRPVVATSSHGLCPAGGELELSLHDKGGRMVWRSRARTAMTDVADLSLVERWGSATTAPPGTACAVAGPCGGCPSLPELGEAIQGALATQAAGAMLAAP